MFSKLIKKIICFLDKKLEIGSPSKKGMAEGERYIKIRLEGLKNRKQNYLPKNKRKLLRQLYDFCFEYDFYYPTDFEMILVSLENKNYDVLESILKSEKNKDIERFVVDTPVKNRDIPFDFNLYTFSKEKKG